MKMAKTSTYTIAYRNSSVHVDLCKIIFGGDGSYYVTAPYHPANRALIGVYTVNYAAESQLLALSEAKELAVLDDDEQRLKIAHHPDGFLQFSGEGIRSGRDEQGTPKGMGLMTWPLANPTYGPSFQVTFSDPVACGRPSAGRGETITFEDYTLEHMRKAGLNGINIMGYYFPPRWREFVQVAATGERWLDVLHPSGQAIKRLRVVLAATECDYAGLIGVEALPHSLQGAQESPGFIMGTSTGNLRRNEAGELMGDQLMCFYPRPDLGTARVQSLTYRLPAPPPSAPPGTTAVVP